METSAEMIQEGMNVLDKHTDAYWRPISCDNEGEATDLTQMQFMLKFIWTNDFKY